MHAFIVIHGRPHISGERIKEFSHRPDIEPGLYVWENRALTPAEHGEVARKVVERFGVYRPYTRIVADPTPAPAADPREAEIATLKAELARAKAALNGTLSKNPPRNRQT